MKLFLSFIVVGILLGLGNNSSAQMQMERLDRGAIAVRKDQGYQISWRLLGDEPYTTGFNIYRGSTKLNDAPIGNVCSYFDQTAALGSFYYVRAIINGKELSNNKAARVINNSQGSNAAYFDININKPATGIHGGTYSPNDASTGDLNGDGEYDIVLKWDPNNAKDNSQSGITDNVILDGYTLDGLQLWRIDLGPNIRAGAHYTQFLVYDFDGNGKAEIMCKTAPGTKDGLGNYLKKGPAASTDHSKEYRNSSGYILSGPEYLTVFDGETGKELATAEYWPVRGSVSSWGDNYGNRLDRYNATVAYVDGTRPSAVFQRGYYTRLTMAAWNWRNGELSKVWNFDSNTSGNGQYYGQGNHSIHVIDANNDGLHDIVTGSSVISGTGNGMHTTGYGHGDACHVSYMKKGDSRPMIYMCHESGGYGISLRYADNGEIIFNNKQDGDTGRGCAGELDSETPGFKYWGTSHGLCNIDGSRAGSSPNSTNFVIWWDGKLSRELMNSNRIDSWSIKSNSSNRLLTADDCSSNNGSKATPTLQADLFGDWREEVILRLSSNNALRVFISIMPTNYKLYTLMHDPVYRVAVSWQNSSYNQPPHPGYYMASDMDFPQAKPNIEVFSGFNRGSGTIIKDLLVNDIENANHWEIADSLHEKISVYGNKTIFATSLPASLIGQEFIKTSTVSNTWQGNNEMASFKVKTNAIISVFVNETINEIPEWLSSFQRKEEVISVSSPISAPQSMVLYEKNISTGEKVVLGQNTNNGTPDKQMYFVVVRASGQSALNEMNTTGQSLIIYPNPFSTTSTIKYTINQKENVFIGLYDLNGKLVQQIDHTVKNQGINVATIDGTSLNTGIYLVRLISQSKTLQQKIILKK